MLNFSRKRSPQPMRGEPRPMAQGQTGPSRANHLNGGFSRARADSHASGRDSGHDNDGAGQSTGQSAGQSAGDCEWWDNDIDLAFDQAAQQIGLNARQSEGLKQLFVEAVCQAEDEERAESDAAKAETLAELERQWGQDAERQFAAANQAASALGMDEDALAALLVTPRAVDIVSGLAKLGEAMAEDGALPLAHDQQSTLGREGAQAELERLRADKEHVAAYVNNAHPGHKTAKRRRQSLINMTLRQTGPQTHQRNGAY